MAPVYKLLTLLERFFSNDSAPAKLLRTTAVVAVIAGGCSGAVVRNTQDQATPSGTRITETFIPTATPGDTLILQLTPSPTPDITPTPIPTLAPTPTLEPTPQPPAPTRKPAPRPTVAPTPQPVETPPPPQFSEDYYYPHDVFWQTTNACTAASAQIGLNFIASAGTGGSDFSWSVTTSTAEEETILAYERANDVTLATSPGSDPAGERNALNHYGFGGAVVYRDREYGSSSAAIKAVVEAIARTEKPAIALTDYGAHAIVVNGYKVSGGDPADTDSFTVEGVYVTDPLSGDGLRNAYISTGAWTGSGVTTDARFKPDEQTDAVYKDPLDGTVGNTKWHGMYVAILP